MKEKSAGTAARVDERTVMRNILIQSQWSSLEMTLRMNRNVT